MGTNEWHSRLPGPTKRALPHYPAKLAADNAATRLHLTEFRAIDKLTAEECANLENVLPFMNTGTYSSSFIPKGFAWRSERFREAEAKSQVTGRKGGNLVRDWVIFRPNLTQGWSIFGFKGRRSLGPRMFTILRSPD